MTVLPKYFSFPRKDKYVLLKISLIEQNDILFVANTCLELLQVLGVENLTLVDAMLDTDLCVCIVSSWSKHQSMSSRVSRDSAAL